MPSVAISQRLMSILVCALALLGASAAHATALVTFDVGPNGDGFEHGLGLSQATAEGSGVAILGARNNQLFTVVNDADPASSPLLLEESLKSFSATSRNDPAQAVQTWDVTNQTGSDQPGDLVLVFQRPMPNTVEVDGSIESFEYDLGEVTLDLDNGFDWFILRVDGDQPGETWYYPAIRIGPLAIGASIPDPFEMKLTLDPPEIFLRTNEEFVLGLPDWQVRAAYVVPEPGTGLLVGLGCALLAVGRSRKS